VRRIPLNTGLEFEKGDEDERANRRTDRVRVTATRRRTYVVSRKWHPVGRSSLRPDHGVTRPCISHVRSFSRQWLTMAESSERTIWFYHRRLDASAERESHTGCPNRIVPFPPREFVHQFFSFLQKNIKNEEPLTNSRTVWMSDKIILSRLWISILKACLQKYINVENRKIVRNYEDAPILKACLQKYINFKNWKIYEDCDMPILKACLQKYINVENWKIYEDCDMPILKARLQRYINEDRKIDEDCDAPILKACL